MATDASCSPSCQGPAADLKQGLEAAMLVGSEHGCPVTTLTDYPDCLRRLPSVPHQRFCFNWMRSSEHKAQHGFLQLLNPGSRGNALLCWCPRRSGYFADELRKGGWLAYNLTGSILGWVSLQRGTKLRKVAR